MKTWSLRKAKNKAVVGFFFFELTGVLLRIREIILRRWPDIHTFSKLTLLLKNADLGERQDRRPVLPENLMCLPSTHNP